MIDRIEVVHHVNHQKIPVPLIILHRPYRHRLQVLYLALRNDQIHQYLHISLWSCICFHYVIFLLKTPLKYYKHRYEVLLFAQLSVFYQFYLLNWQTLVICSNAYHIPTGWYAAKLYLALDELQKPALLVNNNLLRVLVAFCYHLHTPCYQRPHKIKVKLQITLQHQKVLKVKCQYGIVQKCIYGKCYQFLSIKMVQNPTYLNLVERVDEL